MFTLGHNFAPANIHAGGLRYHGAGVIVSQLLKDGYMEATDIKQLESFEAGCLFAQAEGIIPAPESCHAIAATIREANKCKETGEEKVILFNLSGHGLIDMASYDKYLAGDLQNYELTDNDIRRNLDEIGNSGLIDICHTDERFIEFLYVLRIHFNLHLVSRNQTCFRRDQVFPSLCTLMITQCSGKESSLTALPSK